MTKKKKQLRSKFLKLLSARFSKTSPVSEKKKQLRASFLELLTARSKDISSKDFKLLKSEIEKLSELSGENQKKVIESLRYNLIEITKSRDKMPDWYTPPHASVKIEGPVKVQKDDSIIVAAMAAMFGALTGFLTKLANKTFFTMPVAESFTTPQYVVLIDPVTMKPVRPEEIGKDLIDPRGNGIQTIAAGGGSTHVGARGADSFNDGQQTVVTAGTRVQLDSDQECSRVVIQAHPDNAGDVTVGGVNVVAASATRRGLSLYGSQWEEFRVANLNQLWIDSTADGDKVNFIFEA